MLGDGGGVVTGKDCTQHCVGHREVGHREVGHREVGHREVGHREVGHREVDWRDPSRQVPVHGNEQGHVPGARCPVG